MTCGSLFSGIGGIDLGFQRAGFEIAWQVEIDNAARSVLSRHWPDVPKFEDVCKVGKKQLSKVDVIAFGSPCQDFSVAGQRAGISGKRSGLFFEAIRIVRQLRPTFAVWENVPGVFSSDRGRGFTAVIGAFLECGARDVAWRVLDAQYLGVAQRRERVFLVADFRGQRAGEILFESACMCGHPPTRGKAWEGVAATPRGRSANRGVSEPGRGEDGTGRGTPIVFDWQSGGEVRHNISEAHTSALNSSQTPAVQNRQGVRRLTPRECERLQGLPDDWTQYTANGKEQKDGPRYKQIGNGVAVPVLEWIARRIIEAV